MRRKDTPVSTASQRAAEPSALVTVTLDSCGKDDAKAVLDALHASFTCDDRSPDDAPREAPGAGPTVWTATFDVSTASDRPAATGRLAAPATLTAQGGYNAVDRLRTALAGTFAVAVTGTSSGDQEEEDTLRLS
jgi:hypothetical protein